MRLTTIFNIVFFLLLSASTSAQRLDVVVQRGHNAAIKSIEFTPDGKYLLSGSRDRSVKLWEVSTGRELRSYLDHASTINDLSVSSDGKFFVSSGVDQTAKMWDILTGELIHTFTGHQRLLTDVSLSNDGRYLFTAGYETEARLWDLKTRKVIDTLKVNPEQGLGYGINSEFSPDGNYLAVGNDDRTVNIHDLKTDEVVEIKPSSGSCGGCATFVAYNSDGSRLLSASNNGPVRIIDPSDGSILSILENIDKEYSAVDISPDDKLALLVDEDSIKTYSMKSGQLLYTVKAEHEQPITDAIYSPDGKMIAVSSDDQTIGLYDANTGVLIQKISGFLQKADKGGLNYDANSWDYYIKKYTDLRNDVRISPDGKYLVKGKTGSIARMWDLKSGSIENEFRGHEKAVLCMEFSDDGKYLLTGSADFTAKLWDVKSGKEIRTFTGHREVIFSLDFSDDQRKIVTGSWDGSAKVWDIETAEILSNLYFENASPYRVSFYRNDIYLITSNLDKTLKIWEIDSKKQIREFIGHTDIIQNLDFNNNMSKMVSAGWDGKIKAWDIVSGLQDFRYDDHNGPVYAVEYSHDDQYLATAGKDMVIKIRKAINGKIVKELKGHESSVTSLQFTPNGEYLISSSEDGTIIIWDFDEGKELISYIILDDEEWMVLNSDGYFNATDDALQQIIFVDGLKSYKAEQFFDRFYEPDLLKKTFSQNKSGTNLMDELERSPPPNVEIIAPKSGNIAKKNTISLLAKVTDEGGGAREVNIFHNGKIIVSEKPVFKKSTSTYISHDIRLIPGRNIIEANATNDSGISSPKKRVEVILGGEVEPVLYVVSIGINEYKNPALNLNYAAADADGFVDLIKSKSSKLFNRVEVITLSDEGATKEKILETLSILSGKVTPQDVLFFYYAGHGSMVDNKFYFIPTNVTKLYSEDKLRKEAIFAGDLQQKLKEISALKQLVIIDACQSGAGVELLAQRGASEEKALAQLSRSTGIHVLAAAGSEQFATEFSELGHGLFTYILLEALAGGADGAPKDGKVTIYELKSYLDDQVPEYSKKYKDQLQFPHTFSRGQDFPIVIED